MARQNPFQQLRSVCEAPEAEFELACAELIRTQFSDARRVRVHRGDGGVDTAHGTWGSSGALDVFQVKYFPDVLGSPQRQQVRESYVTATNNSNFRLRSWTLCLPTTLRQEDHEWFDSWKSEQDTHIDLWDGDKLEALLRLAGAGHTRERFKTLGVVGLPSSAPDLRPVLHARQCDPATGTGFYLQIELTNLGDAAADNVRATVTHTRETQHVANTPFRPWRHDNQEYNPWELVLTRTMNPGEHLPVMRIPFGGQAPRKGRIEFKIGSRTTVLRKWYVEASETDITNNAKIEFTPDAVPWKVNDTPARTDEPQFAAAKMLLDGIFANENSETQGLTVILVSVPGQIGTTNYYLSTANGAKQGEVAQMDTDELEQAISELMSLGWIKFRGADRARQVYTLLKRR